MSKEQERIYQLEQVNHINKGEKKKLKMQLEWTQRLFKTSQKTINQMEQR
jgi:hypothetical protein